MPSQLGITSISLGRCYAGHDLPHKLDMARAHGFHGIELFHEDLADIASKLPGGETPENQLEAAHIIRKLCAERDLTIICLQPFWHYEALRDREEHERRIEKLHLWFKLATALGTDLIQVPANYLPREQVSEDWDLVVSDLRKMADLGLAQDPPFRFVYEGIAWSTTCDTWEKSWDAIVAVDRPNFGLCLDTFNIAGRIYADPTSPDGRTRDCETAVQESIQRLVTRVDVKKLFYVQIVDGQRLDDGPIVKGHRLYEEGMPERMCWSRACRLFYGEQDRGAYLPILALSQAIFNGLGFDGWVSMELFNARLADKDQDVPREMASRGATAWDKLVKDVGIEAAPKNTAPAQGEDNRVAASL